METRVERHLPQLEIQVLKRFEQETPHVDGWASAVIGVKPRVDNEDGLHAHPTRNGVGKGGIVVETKRIEPKPMQRGRRLRACADHGVRGRRCKGVHFYL